MRTFDGTRLTEMANHPSIRPALGGIEGSSIDLQEAADNFANYCFVSDHGGFICIPVVNGGTSIECHTIPAPGGNVKALIRFMRECQEYVFVQTKYTEIVTKVPDDNIGADKMSTLGGFTEKFRREDAWKLGVGISYRSFPLDRWVATCSSTREAGKAFHALLDEAKLRQGSALPVHGDDEIHDRWVGAAVLMALQGNLIKAVNSYNGWASFAGYRTIVLLSEQPPIIDVRDAIVGRTTDGKMEVLHCR